MQSLDIAGYGVLCGDAVLSADDRVCDRLNADEADRALDSQSLPDCGLDVLELGQVLRFQRAVTDNTVNFLLGFEICMWVLEQVVK